MSDSDSVAPAYGWESEDQLLHEMARWEPLPDENDPCWEADDDYTGV